MVTKLQIMKWNLYNYKSKQLLIYGLKKGYIAPYDDILIEKLRTIYYGGIPASIILLSDCMSNGYCYDRALLMSRAFLEEEGDVRLVYASIDSLRLNPQLVNSTDQLYADHCIVERVTKDGKHLIYDTSSGFVYDKKLYWLMEHPIIRHINNKNSIIEFIKSDEHYNPENIKNFQLFLSTFFISPCFFVTKTTIHAIIKITIFSCCNSVRCLCSGTLYHFLRHLRQQQAVACWALKTG